MHKLTKFLIGSTFVVNLNVMAAERQEALVPTPEVVSLVQIENHIANGVNQQLQQASTELTEHTKERLKEVVQAAIYAAKSLL